VAGPASDPAASPPVVAEPSLLESPTTLIALPPTTTGTPASVSTWVPPAVESSPLVEPDGPDEPLPAVPDAVPDWPEYESPATLIALPLTVTGASASPTIWLPPAVASSPEVLADPDSPDPLAPAKDDPSLELSPSTEMELPATPIGIVAPATPWVPPSNESVPPVEAPDPLLPDSVLAPVDVDPELDESPSTEMALPPTPIGATASSSD
jgi:hypothetical protein